MMEEGKLVYPLIHPAKKLASYTEGGVGGQTGGSFRVVLDFLFLLDQAKRKEKKEN
jgi:hypothetical protein